MFDLGRAHSEPGNRKSWKYSAVAQVRRANFRATRPDDSHRLALLIEATIRTTLGIGDGAGGALAVMAKSDLPVTILVSPRSRLGSLEPAAVAFISSPGSATVIEGDHATRQ
jgi:hypothetical protein